MRNRAAWELTERHQSLVTRTETLINGLHSADRRVGTSCAPKTLFSTDENPLKTLPCLNGIDLFSICSLSKHSPYSDTMTCCTRAAVSLFQSPKKWIECVIYIHTYIHKNIQYVTFNPAHRRTHKQAYDVTLKTLKNFYKLQ